MDPEGRAEDGVEIWDIYKEITKQRGEGHCQLTVTLVEIPEFEGITREAILEMKTTKEALDNALPTLDTYGVHEKYRRWQDSINEMLVDPNVVKNSETLHWSWEDRKFS